MRKWLRYGLWTAGVFGALLAILFPVLLMMTERSLERVEANLQKTRAGLTAKLAQAAAQKATCQDLPAESESAPPSPGIDTLSTIAMLSDQYQSLQKTCPWVLGGKSFTLRNATRQKETREFLKQYASLLDEIRRLAKNAGKGTMNGVDRDRLKEISAITNTTLFARLLAISAGVAASDGNADLAVDDLSAAFALAMATQPLGMAQRRCWDEAYDGLLNALDASGGLPQSQLDSLVQMAGDALPSRDAFAVGMLNEFEGASIMANEPSTMLTTENPEWPARLMIGAASLPITKPLRLNEVSFVGADIDHVLPLASRPYYEVAGQLREVESESRRAYSVFARVAGSIGSSYFVNQVRSEAELGLLQLAVALGKYRESNGAYPPSLDAIASSFGGHVPLDPFTGQPYRYRASGNGFVLYSLGPNQVDDGGSSDDLAWTGQKKSAASPKARMEHAKA